MPCRFHREIQSSHPHQWQHPAAPGGLFRYDRESLFAHKAGASVLIWCHPRSAWVCENGGRCAPAVWTMQIQGQ